MATQKVHPLDRTNLWYAQRISDPAHGDLIIDYPVDPWGNPDPLRKPRFRGECLLDGKITLGFPIEANDPEEALAEWVNTAAKAINEFNSNMTRQRILSGGKPPINGRG